MITHFHKPLSHTVLLLSAIVGTGLLDVASFCHEVSAAEPASPLVYEGSEGPGFGKHIVFLAGDHEYRSEEMLPALARILAKRYGFRCTCLFTLDRDSETIVPGSSNMPHTQAIDSADLLILGLRFQNFPSEQMQPMVNYLARGGPVVGIRTSTHAFKIPSDSPYAKFDHESKDPAMLGGFGRQILGETWAGHYGTNHVMSTRMDIVPESKSHPILRGVDSIWVESGGYWTAPIEDATVLAMTQPLQGMTPDSPPANDKQPCPGVWVRSYQSASGNVGRVFTTTAGASEDLKNDGFRRLMINACLWSSGLESEIVANANIDFVGPYHPATFSFGGHRQDVRPSELSGWESPIMSPDKIVAPPRRRR